MEKTYSAAADLAAIKKHLADQETPSWHWLFYGDSITHGAKHTHGWRSFPEIFAERVRYELGKPLDIVINSAFSGHTTTQLIDPEQYQLRVRCFAPQVVFIMIGINDIIRVNDPEKYRENLEILLALIRADGAIPVLQTCMPFQNDPGNANYVKRYQERPLYNSIIRETARQKEVILIDQDAAWQKVAPTPEKLVRLLGEHLHPGPLGHLECAKEIFRALGIYDPQALSCNPIGTCHSIEVL